MRRQREVIHTARLLVFLSALLSSSCEGIEQSLIDLNKATVDKRLFGAWKHVEKDKASHGYCYTFFGRASKSGPPGLMKMVTVSTDLDDFFEKSKALYFFRATLGEANYAHLIMAEVTESKDGSVDWDRSNARYQLVKYVVDKHHLTIWLMDPESAQKAVEKGRLKGRVTKHKFEWESVLITESAAGLSRYLTHGGDRVLFPDNKPCRHDFVRAE